jgi:hypothetical protein
MLGGLFGKSKKQQFKDKQKKYNDENKSKFQTKEQNYAKGNIKKKNQDKLPPQQIIDVKYAKLLVIYKFKKKAI